jgi:hypothetical protein
LKPKQPQNIPDMRIHAASRRSNQQTLQICVVFDDNTSASSAEVMIRQVASDYEQEVNWFHFDELDGPTHGIAAARRASDADIMVFAVRENRNLPSHVRLWVGLCLGIRDRDNEGALIALIIQSEGASEVDPSLVDYLDTVAVIGGLAFFVTYALAHIGTSAGAPVAVRMNNQADSSVRIE